MLTRPELRWTDDPFLAMHEAEVMIATGRNIIRSREEVASINQGWEYSVLTNLALIRFHEDSAEVAHLIPQNGGDYDDEGE